MTQNNMEVVAFLKEAAKYFANRDTGGEDRAHWANVYNSETCLKSAEALTSAQAEIGRLKEELGRLELSRGAASKVALDNIDRAAAAEKERDALREALNELLDAYSKPDAGLCCSGQDCGCMGATVRQLAEYGARQTLSALQPLEPNND